MRRRISWAEVLIWTTIIAVFALGIAAIAAAMTTAIAIDKQFPPGSAVRVRLLDVDGIIVGRIHRSDDARVLLLQYKDECGAIHELHVSPGQIEPLPPTPERLQMPTKVAQKRDPE